MWKKHPHRNASQISFLIDGREVSPPASIPVGDVASFPDCACLSKHVRRPCRKTGEFTKGAWVDSGSVCLGEGIKTCVQLFATEGGKGDKGCLLVSTRRFWYIGQERHMIQKDKWLASNRSCKHLFPFHCNLRTYSRIGQKFTLFRKTFPHYPSGCTASRWFYLWVCDTSTGREARNCVESLVSFQSWLHSEAKNHTSTVSLGSGRMSSLLSICNREKINTVWKLPFSFSNLSILLQPFMLS